jgi:multimeric flavodoxin WrbA
MKIVVLNGSPKGEISVTMQYVGFIQKKFPQHELKVLNIAQSGRQIESKAEIFQAIIEDIKEADGILWAFPLYVFLVHSQYKRFIELISERSAEAAFKGKPAAILTTSIHFYDHTAHNYMHGICDDLDMNFYASYSAEMYDLLKESERAKLLLFFQDFFEVIDRKAPASKVYPPLNVQASEYTPRTAVDPVDTCGRKIVIVTDEEEDHRNLKQMVQRVAAHFTGQAEVINLHNVDIKGGCLGCIRCGYDNTCVYRGKDGFIDFYNGKLKTADILIFAGTIRDRYLSSLWKKFFDRGFFNTHTPTLMGKQIAFLVSGPLEQLANLRQIIEAYTEWQQANLVGIVTDEERDSQKIDDLLRELAIRSVKYVNAQYSRPTTFLGLGGRKIFRDEIWGELQFPFAADHQFYKNKGFYDFPQKDYTTRMRNVILGWMIKIPAIRKRIYGEMMIGKIVEPFQKLLNKL